MNVDELVGGVLYHNPDVDQAAKALLRLLLDPSTASPDRVQGTGLDPELVEVARRSLPSDPTAIAIACALGAAWAKGRRSAEADLQAAWEPVVTISPSTPLPEGVRRGTAETLIALFTSARNRVQIAAPFVDERGIAHLTGALVAASRRGVLVDLYFSDRSPWVERAVNAFHATVQRDGDWTRVKVHLAAVPTPWPHLKVVVVDSTVAYVGSANITGPGLSGGNLEVGILVRGSQVSAIARILMRFV